MFQWFQWFLVYSILIWTLSIALMVPPFLCFTPRNAEWRTKLAQKMISLMAKMQLFLAMLLTAMYLLGGIGGIHSPLLILNISFQRLQQEIPFLGLIPFLVILSAIYLWFYVIPKMKKSGEVLRNHILPVFFINLIFLFTFTLVSDFLFSGPPVLRPFEIYLPDALSRFAHILFSAAALVPALAVLSIYPKDTDPSDAQKYTLKWMTLAGGFQLLTGVAMIMTIQLKFLPAPLGHIAMTIAILLAIGAMVMAATALQKTENIAKLARGAAWTVIFTMFAMIALRVIHLKGLASIYG